MPRQPNKPLTDNQRFFLEQFRSGADPFAVDRTMRAERKTTRDDFDDLWDWAKIENLLGPIFVQITYLNERGKAALERGTT